MTKIITCMYTWKLKSDTLMQVIGYTWLAGVGGSLVGFRKQQTVKADIMMRLHQVSNLEMSTKIDNFIYMFFVSFCSCC